MGVFISKAFAARKEFTTTLVLRKGSTYSKEQQSTLAALKAAGLATVEADWTSVESLQAALKGIDVVISVVASDSVVRSSGFSRACSPSNVVALAIPAD